MRRRKVIKCLFCGVAITWAGKGRKPSYCSPSHRQRAYEARKMKRLTSNPAFVLKRDLAEVGKMLDEGKIRQVMLDVLQEMGLIPKMRPVKKRPLQLINKVQPEKNDK